MIADHSAIVARGMGVRRGGRWLLRPVAFGITEGVVGLAGQPGAGKSTLLATFATLRRPQTGALEILGHDVGNSTGLRAVRARIGYLPGKFSWAENMTAGEFVRYAAYYKRVREPQVREVLKRFDLTEAAAIELALLPPDVRLRAGLAATCVHEPELVLLDDPFGELAAHPAAAAELVPVVRTMAPAVVVADTDEALAGWCDRLFTLDRGRLTELPEHAPAQDRAAAAQARRPAASPVRPASERSDAERPAPERSAVIQRLRPLRARMSAGLELLAAGSSAGG
ncbi:ATP-binding cassette domain-containing protein [Actinomadura hibisca]|uniref:ATP-binding cassette domain-containing protein n=1 Tax=Actinomadura hibisca TaxID=68565 RepID=UPI000A071879|nr:ATP-binding cassette domain-containing protein [Actinomadura hibisca]